MKTNINKPIKVNIITLGCSKNLVDSEVLLKQLDVNNIVVSHDVESGDFDFVIVNTCGFINDAKQESIDTILQLVQDKANGKIKKIIVMGCLSSRYSAMLKNEIPEVDAYFGVNSMKEVLHYLKLDYKKELLGERCLTTPSHYAYLKIAEGCDRTCSFCAIPGIRGSFVSKKITDVVAEAKILVSNGVKELILIAQDLTYYGLDIYKKRKLAELLDQLSSVEKLSWIRLQYAYPAAFPMDVIHVIKERKNICKYLDIPFQHISDKILKSMNRVIDKKGTLQLIEKIKKEIPDIALRTSLIVGYPGETKKDFKDLMDFVSEVEFERLGVFTYSHEESTKAYQLKDNISASEKQERADILMQLQENISYKKNEALVGKTINVLVDRKENDFYIGRTEYDSPEVDNEVIIQSPSKSKLIGQFKKVKIIQAEPFDLIGKFTS